MYPAEWILDAEYCKGLRGKRLRDKCERFASGTDAPAKRPHAYINTQSYATAKNKPYVPRTFSYVCGTLQWILMRNIVISIKLLMHNIVKDIIIIIIIMRVEKCTNIQIITVTLQRVPPRTVIRSNGLIVINRDVLRGVQKQEIFGAVENHCSFQAKRTNAGLIWS